ncbi:MAG: 4Fe-4S binding protein [Bacteroidales bacterium]|nr:4Fe-4S binding protein [Bacteroidales bacterium]
MDFNTENKLVYTIPDLCRVCYTCVRECPAKAIKIINGQAQIITERCIGCGNCTRVCSQGAKLYRQSVDEVASLLESGKEVIALIAPSFPAEFQEYEDYKLFVGTVKAMGFSRVCEVAFGADLVAIEYNKLWKNDSKNRYISSDCPGIVSYINHYYPNLVKNLAPIVSPVVAMAKVVRKKYGQNIKTVFIGPCVAKKDESKEVDEVITFAELRKLFERNKCLLNNIVPVEFDPPLAGRGAIFPVSHGLVQTSDVSNDILENDVIVAEGRINFQDAIKEFDSGLNKTNHLELLCCEGCILGPGMTDDSNKYIKGTMVNRYVKDKLNSINIQQWNDEIEEYKTLDFSCRFPVQEQSVGSPTDEEIEKVLIRMGKIDENDHLDCGACGYDTCREHAIAIINGLAETEMCLPYTIEKLHKSIKDLEVSNQQLASVQQTLKQAEKLATMGQLSAGIAHELNNPLGVLIMYSNILLEETNKDSQQYDDLILIVEQANRCKKIVSGLLNFARKNQVNPKEINLVELIQQCFNSVIIPKNIKLNFLRKLSNQNAILDFDQIIQVITNLMKNAIEAMPNGGELTVELVEIFDDIKIIVKDTGVGIAKEDIDKLFEPFFTTKGIGFGTGLGLATAYGIVKMHKGQISVESNADKDRGPTGTTFEIKLPRNGMNYE